MTEIPRRKHPLAHCEVCPWRNHSGFADAAGPKDADILIVGEAPGTEEVKQGKVFVGPSGRLLDKVLTHHGLNRSAITRRNVVSCHPKRVPGEKPPKDAISACAPRLSIELQSRETFILLRKTAFETVMETREAITKARQGPP